MSSRVGDMFLRKPLVVDGATDIVSMCREMADRGVTDAVIDDGERYGMFTTTNLRDVLLMDQPAAQVPVRVVATFPTVDIGVDDDLFQAMILMLRHRVHRLVVRDQQGGIAGLLSQLDLLAIVAGQSHRIAAHASAAEDIAALKHAADQIEPLIRALHSDGVNVAKISALTGELNRTVFRRLWELVAPADLRARSCLIVMGSEGRGEQIIRTDQDNGLILSDDADPDAAATATMAFTAALTEFGYPPCPGGVMASNPAWCQTVAGYRQMIGRWLYSDDADGPMKLAIFMDALAVAGDGMLLAGVRSHLIGLITDNDAYLARFAASVNGFSQDRSWWTRLPGVRGRASAEIDLKKLGIFPIVQGVRALALQHRLEVLPTADRLAALVAGRHIVPNLARDLTDALHFLMGAKLDNNLRQIAAGRTPDNLVRLDELGTLDRQSLKDSLNIVRDFRQWVSQHFHVTG